MNESCKVVCFLNGLLIDACAYFNLAHSLDELHHGVLVFKPEFLHGGEVGELTHSINIRNGVVL